jgi:hypothetical protein
MSYSIKVVQQKIREINKIVKNLIKLKDKYIL